MYKMTVIYLVPFHAKNSILIVYLCSKFILFSESMPSHVRKNRFAQKYVSKHRVECNWYDTGERPV